MIPVIKSAHKKSDTISLFLITLMMKTDYCSTIRATRINAACRGAKLNFEIVLTLPHIACREKRILEQIAFVLDSDVLPNGIHTRTILGGDDDGEILDDYVLSCHSRGIIR